MGLTMSTLQDEVAEWHRQAFPDCDPVEIMKKLAEEVAELTLEIGGYGYEARFSNAEAELADAAIVLLALADLCQVDLVAAARIRLRDVRERYPPA